MGKIIAAINMTIDGYCDHDVITPDKEIHRHYADLLKTADLALYGRTTYQLMEYWKPVAKNPTGIKETDEFAEIINKISKLVFSRTLQSVDWETARLAKRSPEEEIAELKSTTAGDILVCSPGLIVALTQSGLIEEYQLCIHPVIAGSGLPLFKNIKEKMELKLVNTKHFQSGPVILYYEPVTRV